jgi:spore germination protein GerM
VAHRAQGAVALALSVLLVAVAAGCGLSTNDEPEAIDDPVPEPVDADTEAPDLGGVDGTQPASVWFLSTGEDDETRLIEVERRVSPPPTPRQVLEALIQESPTDAERADGISTDIPDDVTIDEPPDLRSDGVLIVELSPEFYDLQGERARNAFAQIVFTATGLPEVRMVQFERDGEVFNAVDGDGQSRAVLSRESYAELNDETTTTEPA